MATDGNLLLALILKLKFEVDIHCINYQDLLAETEFMKYKPVTFL